MAAKPNWIRRPSRHAQDPANTDDDGADLAFAVENAIIDIPNGLTSSVVNGLADKHPCEPLIGWLLGDADVLYNAEAVGPMGAATLDEA